MEAALNETVVQPAVCFGSETHAPLRHANRMECRNKPPGGASGLSFPGRKGAARSHSKGSGSGLHEQIPAITYFRAKGTIIGPGGLTAVFGMGTGVTLLVRSPESRLQARWHLQAR